MSGKPGKALSYYVLKPALEKAVQERKSCMKLAEELGISRGTAWKYRAKYLRERGEINDKLARELRDEYVARTKQDLDLAETIALHYMTAPGENVKVWDKKAGVEREVFVSFGQTEKTNGIYALLQVKRELREFLEAAGVIQKVSGFAQVNVQDNRVQNLTIQDVRAVLKDAALREVGEASK
ncbi:MAG: hypothetical protein M0R66_01245 [Candidatus Omnitrophica bacterium]|nr:hypothetical protein [Candidatus Omnitrophota bacterium]